MDNELVFITGATRQFSCTRRVKSEDTADVEIAKDAEKEESEPLEQVLKELDL